MSALVRSEQPGDGDERTILLGWLAFHRDALEAKCRGLTDEQLVTRAADPSHLTLLGLVRHMAEMERVYGLHGPLPWLWGDYENDEEHDFDCTAAAVAEPFRAWRDEKTQTDAAIARHSRLDEIGAGNRRSVRWNLAKLVGEYARHNGHADLLRERIDGQTGE